MALSHMLYNSIIAMRDSNSTLAKERVLMAYKNSPTFKRILYLAYSPYNKFHIRKIPKQYIGKGTNELSPDTWTLLNRLSLRKLTGTAARESLFEHIESLTPAAAEILKMIVKKDLKCGVAATTINKVFPDLIPTFHCQGVDDWSDVKAKWPMLVSPKVDCIRGEFRGGEMYTRRGHKVVGVNHIVRYLESIGNPMELSGELYIPGMPFHRSSGILRSNKPQKPNVKFAIFDIPSLDTMPYDQRHKYLSKTFFPIGTNPHPPAVYIPHVMVDNKEQAVSYFHACCKRGFEGLVGKNPNGFVKKGKGSYDWMRIVKGASAEYRIIDVYESEEMPGCLGGIIIEGNIKVGSGFAQDERVKYYANPGLIIGKFATIVFKEKTKAGSLRQPIFKEIRWDI